MDREDAGKKKEEVASQIKRENRRYKMEAR